MDNTDKVSIVIPVYNNEKFLNESIVSIIKQTYNNIEIIAINDGSTDESLKILNQYSDKITIINQENKGLTAALKTGTNYMSGKWFKWFSPDDILYPNAIETLVTETKKFPKNTIVYSNWEIIDENGKKLRDFHESNYNDLDNFQFNLRLLDGQQINVNTTLIPSSIFKIGCTFQTLDDPTVIDYDFFLRAGILFNVNFHLIPKSLVKYRIHPKQLSHKNIINSLAILKKVQNDILLKLDENENRKYQEGFQEYSKNKPLTKKTLKIGLNFLQNYLPENISNRMLVFYLNNIRRNR